MNKEKIREIMETLEKARMCLLVGYDIDNQPLSESDAYEDIVKAQSKLQSLMEGGGGLTDTGLVEFKCNGCSENWACRLTLPAISWSGDEPEYCPADGTEQHWTGPKPVMGVECCNPQEPEGE